MDISWTEEITLLSKSCGHLEMAFEGMCVSQEMAMLLFPKRMWVERIRRIYDGHLSQLWLTLHKIQAFLENGNQCIRV